ncbi:MAG: ATP-dependent nuclease [Solirubrobacterales bacterium]
MLGVEVENLRSFERTALDLKRPVTLLVGPNNSGKTSILRMLDWSFNGDPREFEGHPMAPGIVEMLQPARTTRAKARRLSLMVSIKDGRRHQRFKCEGGVARLRIGLRVSPEPTIRVNLGSPTRSEGGTRDEDAYALLEELRQFTRFRLIPASRDASSLSFSNALNGAITRRLETGAINVGRGRGPAGYRTVADALKSVTTVAEELVHPLWEEMQEGLPAGMAKTGTIKVDAEPTDLVSWIASVLRLRLSTGAHDVKSVKPTEVGSGLQSLLELGLAQTEAEAVAATSVTALEEPEAFLHPSAQRTLARDLFQVVSGKRIVSTHSPILVEEAEYGDVVLAHDRQFHHPSDQTESQRAEINSAFLTQHGAEMVFAKGVLLVEGESDHELFEGLRRRLAVYDESGTIDGLMAIPTGSKDRFGPWLRLIRSYRTGSGSPLNWLALVDADAPAAIQTGFKQGGVRVEPELKAALNKLAEANAGPDLEARFKAAQQANRKAEELRVRIAICPGDLEWACLHSIPAGVASTLSEAMGLECESGPELAEALGTKHSQNPRPGKKEPWRRALIAKQLPLDEISPDIKSVLRRWFRLVMADVQAKRIISAGEAAAAAQR